MFYRLAADFTVILHFLWILFLIFGAFAGRRYRTAKIFHVGGLGFAVIIQIFGWYCPLTHIEIWLRQKYDPSLTYSGSFIVHYVEEIVYIELSPAIIFILTLIMIAVSGLIYFKRKEK